MDRVYPFRAHAPRSRRQRQWRSPSPLAIMLPAFALFVLYHSTAPDVAQMTEQPKVVSIGSGSIDAMFSFCRGGARVNCVVDGDTFYYNGTKIRLADIDTPEIFSPRCSEEADLGTEAMHRLRTLLNAGPFHLSTTGSRNRDRYGRKLRLAIRDGESIGLMLVSDGLARRWTGRREPWCV